MINFEKLNEKAEKLNVLYVEDDKEVRETMQEIFSELFANVDVANNGKEGLDKYEIGKYHIIFSDIKMPIMDGLEMLKSIKERDLNQVSIVITAHEEMDYLENFLEIGINRYIIKPIDFDSFFETIAELILKIDI